MPPGMPSPKVELHVHLEATIQPARLLEIARRNDAPLPADTVEGISALYRFRDFRHFIDTWVMTTNCLRTADDFRQIVVDYAQEAAGLGAVYLEAIFSPPERGLLGGPDWDEIYTRHTQGGVGAYERFGVTVAFTPDIYRHRWPSWRSAVSFWTCARPRTCVPGWCRSWPYTRCRRCTGPECSARSTPTTRSCSARTFPASTRSPRSSVSAPSTRTRRGSPGRCATTVPATGWPAWRRSLADWWMSRILSGFSLADIGRPAQPT